jgi:uncharacterized membrane protein
MNLFNFRAITFGWNPEPHEWAFAAIAVAMILSEVLISAGKVQPRRLGLALACLRIAGLIGVLALISEIQWIVEDTSVLRRRVALVVDDSQSMAVQDGEAPRSARWQRAELSWSANAEVLGKWREQGLDVVVHRFNDAKIAPLALGESLFGASPSGVSSDFSASLAAVAQSGREDEIARPLAAVVLLSDGELNDGETGSQNLLDVVTTLDVPITTLATSSAPMFDLALVRPKVADYAFAENVSVFAIDVTAQGVVDLQTNVELRRNGEKIASERVFLRGTDPVQSISFRVAPERTGEFVYSFHLDAAPDEATLDNNTRRFVVQVLRDKVRVLHVAGRPDWDVRSLRTLLKRDPNVELLSYYILRSREDTERDDPDAPLSLIAFPHAELFEEQLGSFDAVVMQNFDAHTHANYLENIARYVVDGGSLVLIGGDLGLATGDYLDPAFVRILPSRPLIQAPDRSPFRPALTSAGLRHPITSWFGRIPLSEREHLPQFDTYNPSRASTASQAGIQVLLEHPGYGGNAPLLSIAQPGKGRLVVAATGSSWRWSFADELPMIDGLRPYDHLWRGIFRWLLQEDASTRIRLNIPEPRVPIGTRIQLDVSTLSTDFHPEGAVEVHWQVHEVPLLKESDIESVVAQGNWVSDEQGKIAASLDALPRGAYEIRAWRDDESREQTPLYARKVVLVGEQGRELEMLAPTKGQALLRSIAEASEGQFVDLAAGEKWPANLITSSVKDERARELATRGIPLWTGWIALLAIVLTLPLEWMIRRRNGQS